MAFSLMSAFGVASGLLDIFGGTRKKKDNSKIANAQEKLARQRYDYNIKESNDAYEENLRNTFAGYATQRMNVINSVKDETSKINTYAANTQNIELEGSSIMLDSLNNLDYELNNAMQNIYENQGNALKGLVQENVNLNYQLQTNLSDQIVNIKTKQAQLNAQADQEIMSGLIGVGTSVFDMWNSSRGSKASLTNIQNESFGNYLNSNFSSMLYPQNNSYSYGSLNTGNLFYNNDNIYNTVMNTRSNPYLGGFFTNNIVNRRLGG
mgnify:CR=1 FL=1